MGVKKANEIARLDLRNGAGRFKEAIRVIGRRADHMLIVMDGERTWSEASTADRDIGCERGAE